MSAKHHSNMNINKHRLLNNFLVSLWYAPAGISILLKVVCLDRKSLESACLHFIFQPNCCCICLYCDMFILL